MTSDPNTLPIGHTAHHADGAIWLALPYLDLSELPSPNKRPHWAVKNRQTQNVRETTHWLAKKAKIGTQPHVTVELHYLPPDNRRRDSDNLMLILKAACDGLVDAGIVADDTPLFMTKVMPLIHPKAALNTGQARLLLRILPSTRAT